MFTAADLQTIETGTDANVQLRTASAVAPPQGNPAANAAPARLPPRPSRWWPEGTSAALRAEHDRSEAGRHGDGGRGGAKCDGPFLIPILLQYNPAVISVEEVRHGGFLSGGSGEEALVQRIDQQHGQAVISASRTANTPGVSGTGTLVGIVIRDSRRAIRS